MKAPQLCALLGNPTNNLSMQITGVMHEKKIKTLFFMGHKLLLDDWRSRCGLDIEELGLALLDFWYPSVVIDGELAPLIGTPDGGTFAEQAFEQIEAKIGRHPVIWKDAVIAMSLAIHEHTMLYDSPFVQRVKVMGDYTVYASATPEERERLVEGIVHRRFFKGY